MRHDAFLAGVLAFILAGCGRASEAPPAGGSGAAAPSADERMSLVLARVGDMEVTAEDLRNHMITVTTPENAEIHMKNPDIVQVALGALVDQFVWAEIARQDGVKLTPGEEHRVAALEAELLATRYMETVLQSKATPTRQEVEEYYHQHQDQFLSPPRVAVRHILLGTEAEARRLLQEARSGADFAALARKYSTDEVTRDIGGALGFVQEKAEIPGMGRHETFAKAVLALGEGDLDVIQTQRGWHLVKVEKREGGDLLPLDEVYERIATPMIRQRFGPMYNEELTLARERVGVVYDSKNFDKFTGIPNNCDRLMELAEQAPENATKVELYRRLAADFPDCEHAGKAQFMIGYTQLVALDNKPAARKALVRLQDKFRGSEWRKAGEYLLEHLDDDPKSLGTPEEVLAKASR